MSKRKLLLADDSVTIQKVVNLTFADEGIEVISVGDGDSAMAMVAQISPDLIMADVNMPGLTGYQICERIRGDASLQHTPVILLVGSFEPFDEAEAKRVGADDFLTKPFQSIRQLVNKVTILLNSGREEVFVSAPVVTENAASIEHLDTLPIMTEGSSYLETLEMEKPNANFASVQSNYYPNSTVSEEIPPITPTTAYSFDESPKFETKTEIPSDADLLKTQAFSTEDIHSLELEQPQAFSAQEEFADFNAPDSAQDILETEEISNTQADEALNNFNRLKENNFSQDEDMPLPEAAAVLQLDDDDPLELPPIEFDFDDEDDEDYYEEQNLAEFDSTETPVTENIEPVLEQKAEQFEKVDYSDNQIQVSNANFNESQQTTPFNLSPDLIDAIVQKVMERLSDKVIREVAWDVVPPMTELIVKKMAEEKLKK